MKNRLTGRCSLGPFREMLLLSIVVFCLVTLPVSALSAEKLIVTDSNGMTTFKIEDNGSVSNASRLCANGASAWGSAPFVLGQDLGNRGIVITNKATSNQKNIYFGWNVGTSQDYAEMFALQEGVGYKNLVLNPSGGYVGIGTASPSYPLQMGSGAYCSTGGTWVNASSREYKKDIENLSPGEATDTLNRLNPVKFRYKVDEEERHVGFIAEDAPDLVATKDKKGMSPMDVVAVLTRVVQEQQKVMEAQKQTIEELSRRLALVEQDTRKLAMEKPN